MNFITKLLLIVFFNFIVLKVYTIDMPKDLIVKIIKESENQDDTKSKNLDLISVKYTGGFLIVMLLQITIVMQKEKCLIVIFLIHFTILNHFNLF